MHTLLGGAAVAVVCLGLGYGVRGWIHKHLIASHEEVESWAQRIGTALAKGEADLRADVGKVLTELRAKL
jgi:hypothetical protein